MAEKYQTRNPDLMRNEQYEKRNNISHEKESGQQKQGEVENNNKTGKREQPEMHCNCEIFVFKS
jgi:hypothetical protein